MLPPDADAVLVRHGDVGVKSSSVQAGMERTLRDNVAALMEDRGVSGTVERELGRVIVRSEDADAAADAATDAFGVVSASPARTVPPDLDAIRDVLAETAREHYDGGTFAVRARRTGEHDFTSHDVGQDGGQTIWNVAEDEKEFAPEVDLDDPDWEVSVEVREEEAFVFLEKREGPGGLPLGTQAPFVALVSGGIDSPVAAWEAMKRGSPVIPVYLDLGPYGGPDHEARAVETVRRLSRYAPNFDMDLRRVPAGPHVQKLGEQTGRTRMLHYRRFMYRVAEHVAEAEGGVGIVTGEAIGQKSSQTATNFAAVDRAAALPIHRPLLTWDKHDIIDAAKAIGTFQDATMNVGCNRLAPDQPATATKFPMVKSAEPDDLFEWAAEAAENADVVSVDPADAVDAEPEESTP
ncbi:tRNA sulfurtransferase [Halospeciosus flavus]|uniref:Probable tRNA sulfurtransferase n=1 Tax=Halospeciosus flavus TaxID=3032283 RepID=A0ABD5Z1P4_9EURY|nr:tRNA sulfurtransferase [Halospeciosus flavus]